MLPKAFVVSEQEELILLDRAAQRTAKAVALELRDRPLIEKITRVQRAVAKKIVNRSMQFVGPGSGHDTHLAARTLAVFGAVGVAHHIEFADGINSQQLAAGPAGGVVDDGCSGEFDPV